jgi:predicted TIM-barrel fold metal-dependent hydrolase
MLNERLPEIGIDYALLYTTTAMGFLAVPDAELRRGLCAGWNSYLADLNKPYLGRMAFAGLIPMHDPEEAVAEMRHCAELGLRIVALPEGVLRTIQSPDSTTPSPFLWPNQTHWFDTFGLDSAHDYDPVWAEAQRLGYPVTFHGGLGLKPGVWTSVSNYSHNHIGLFAQLMNALCKSLYFGGVTRRFPGHPFVFLECGVAWGAQMLGDIVEHWHKRNLDSLSVLDPSNLDVDQLKRYYDQYGADFDQLLDGQNVVALFEAMRHSPTPDELDDWKALGPVDEAGIVDAFVDTLYFGCEADDSGVAQAFSPTNPRGAELKPIFSSDIGHWDVTSIDDLVHESMELVDAGALTAEQYRSFVFGNTAELLQRANPRFFEGTEVASSIPLLPTS